MRALVFLAAVGAVAPATARGAPPRPRLVVFDVEGSGLHLGAPAFERLAAYLTEKAAAMGHDVVPRQALLKHLRAERVGMQRACYDLSCQIEVGQALGAQRALSTKILRLDDSCAVTMALYDLRRATAERTADATCGCELGALVRGLEAAALKIAPSPDATVARTPGVVDRKRCPGRGALRVGQAFPKALSVWCVDARGRRQGPARQWHPSGVLAAKGRYRNDQQQGRWTYYHPNGKRRRQVIYRDGRWHGRWLRWDESGALVEVGACRFGKREGRWMHYDREGNKRREVQYQEDVQQGPVTEWHPNGQQSAEYALRAGQREGPYRSWRADGTLAEAGAFVADRRQGRWITYLPRGETLEEQYRAGVRDGPVTRRRGGKTVEQGRHQAGLREGRWVTYDLSADPPVKVREGVFSRGKMHGRWTTYLRNGAVQTAEDYRDGRRHGASVTYDLDGNKVSEGTYRRDKKHGRWRFFGHDGRPAREETYVEGQRVGTRSAPGR